MTLVFKKMMVLMKLMKAKNFLEVTIWCQRWQQTVALFDFSDEHEVYNQIQILF